MIFAALSGVEYRINQIAQYDRVVLDIFLANQNRVVMINAGDDGQVDTDSRIATAGCSVCVRPCSLRPNHLGLLATDDER